MAMTKCKECKKEVSTKADVCPHCGVKKPGASKGGSKGVWTLLFVVLVLVGIFGGEDKEETQTAPETQAPAAKPETAAPAQKPAKKEKAPSSSGFSQAQLEAALAAVKAEPKVISAAWNSTTTPSLLAGVWDDGSKRDGYAEYLCMVLAEHGIKGGVVRVMDNATTEWRELGKAWCPK